MRTTPFRDVLWDVATLLGLEPADGEQQNLDRFQAAAITRHINRQVRRAWEYFPWPELETVEERWFRDFWTAQVYPEGTEIYHAASDKYYTADGIIAASDVPGVSALWVERPFVKSVALQQTGKTPICEALAAYPLDPGVNDNVGEQGFSVTHHGITFPAGYDGTSVWLRFRIGPASYTSDVWTAISYAAGRRVYSTTTGECYVAAQATTGSDEPGSSSKWTRIDFPFVLQPYTVQAAYADALKEDGQHDRARGEMALAMAYLEDAIAQIVITQGNTARYAVRNRWPSESSRAPQLYPTADITNLTADAA